MNQEKEIHRPNASNSAPRRLLAVGRRVRGGWLIRTNLSQYQEENGTADDKTDTVAA